MRSSIWRLLQVILAIELILTLLATLLTRRKRGLNSIKEELLRPRTATSYLSTLNTKPGLVETTQIIVNTPDETTKMNSASWTRNVIFENGSIFLSWKSYIPNNYSSKPKIVLGIPTVHRENESYLLGTLNSVLKNKGEITEFIVVVYVGDENNESVKKLEKDIGEMFRRELSEGIIQIISPPENFYPDWEVELRESFGDPFRRVKWRSKQNLDQIFLMMYVYFLQPEYYLMLEDDIVTSQNYLDIIYKDAQSRRGDRKIILSYCQLGAIGKLFNRDILPSIATFLTLFWGDKPLDWLLVDYIKSRVCNYEESEQQCKNRINDAHGTYKPSLFQHVGKKSSLPGKVQNLKDGNFKQ